MDTGKLNLNRGKSLKNNTTKVIAGETKTKGFSVKTTPSIFNKFAQINQYYGMSNNSVLNQLIVKYIRENQNILDELENEEE
jgi:hypothetical protein